MVSAPKSPEIYDLHTHSLHSDGTNTVEEIFAMAAELGLAGIAVTDHDTADGWPAARESAKRHQLDFVPGIEVTTKFDGIAVHILAYGVDPQHTALAAELQRVRESRLGRAQRMVERLSQDFDIDWQRVHDRLEPNGTVGRPHIADALVESGHFADRGEAFKLVLHPGSPYYQPTYAIEATDAVRLITAAGGAAVLAHPAAVRQRYAAPAEHVIALAKAGLWGIELDHPENVSSWLEPLRQTAAELGLRVTGASDFHGTGKANELGEMTSSAELVAELREFVRVPN